MKIVLDKQKCIGCGSCAALDPENFVMVESNAKAELVKPDKVENDIYEKKAEITSDCQDATDSCPVIRIEIKED